MSIRSLLPVALLVAGALTAAPASAQSPTDRPVPGAQPGACIDPVSPTSGFSRKAARRAGRHRLLRGAARDIGCGVDRVAISVQHKRGRAVETLVGKARLRKLRRGRQHWFVVRGTTHWSFRLSKRLPRGTYLIRTRAIDFAGNVEKPRVRRLRLR